MIDLNSDYYKFINKYCYSKIQYKDYHHVNYFIEAKYVVVEKYNRIYCPNHWNVVRYSGIIEDILGWGSICYCRDSFKFPYKLLELIPDKRQCKLCSDKSSLYVKKIFS
jgi:hypothetical protein